MYSIIIGLLLNFSGCEVSSLAKSNTVYNYLKVVKAFGKSIFSYGGISVIYREGESMTRINIYSSKIKCSPFKSVA